MKTQFVHEDENLFIGYEAKKNTNFEAQLTVQTPKLNLEGHFFSTSNYSLVKGNLRLTSEYGAAFIDFEASEGFKSIRLNMKSVFETKVFDFQASSADYFQTTRVKFMFDNVSAEGTVKVHLDENTLGFVDIHNE